MPVIGIIDDREDLRITLKRKIDLSLRVLSLSWSTLDTFPFNDLSDYINWIRENDIAVLILDERLQESTLNGINVNYNGSQLIEFLRNSLQEFPVFAITSHTQDVDLQSRFPLFDEILNRQNFLLHANDYTIRFTRAGQRFLEVYNDQLVNLSNLSRKVAIGDATIEDKNKLKALQEYLNMPYASFAFTDRESWLRNYDKKLEELSDISSQIKSFIATVK